MNIRSENHILPTDHVVIMTHPRGTLQRYGFDSAGEAETQALRWSTYRIPSGECLYADWKIEFAAPEWGVTGKPVIYVAHPVSGNARENALACVRWVRWLQLHDDTRIYVAPWVAEVLAFEDSFPPGGKARVISDDMTVVSKLDGAIAVGGTISAGMAAEVGVARSLPSGFTDLSMYRTPEDAEAAGVELEPHNG